MTASPHSVTALIKSLLVTCVPCVGYKKPRCRYVCVEKYAKKFKHKKTRDSSLPLASSGGFNR